MILTFFHRLLIDILHVANNLLVFFRIFLCFVLFRFHGVLVLSLFLLCVYQIGLLSIFVPLLNILYAILGNLVPMGYPISLSDFLVLLSIMQNRMDFFFLGRHLLLHLLFDFLHLCLLVLDICLALKHQSKLLLMFHKHIHFPLIFLHILAFLLYDPLLYILFLVFLCLMILNHQRIILYNVLLFVMVFCVLLLPILTFCLHLHHHLILSGQHL